LGAISFDKAFSWGLGPPKTDIRLRQKGKAEDLLGE
jgi:hypothetical protein